MLSKLLIRLDDAMLGQLDDIARNEHTTKTQLIRDAIAQFLDARERATLDNKLLSYAGILKGTELDVDGLEYQRKVRDEWGSRE